MFKITREQFFEFIKKKDGEIYTQPETFTRATQHYLEYFDKYQATGKKGNWHWFGSIPLWFFYRKMYNYGGGVLLISRLLDKCLEKGLQQLNVTEDIGTLIGGSVIILFALPCMRYADYIYLYYASDKISKGKVTSGVNKWAVIGFLTFVVGIILLVKILNRI